MNYGLYTSALGVMSGMHRQDVIANNLANVNTIGFKPDSVYLRERLPERLESGMHLDDPHLLLERLGGGHFPERTHTNLRQGELIRTDNDLDLAIEGEGFFVVSSGRGRGNEHLRFTRDGRFTLNANGELVMATNGMQVLDSNDQRIRIQPGAAIRIDVSGRVFQNEKLLTNLQVSKIPSVDTLRKAGNNLFMFNSNAQTSRQPTQAHLQQGFIESSAVDPILALNEMISVSKTVQANTRLMQYHDNLMDLAINRFARVA